MMSDFSTDWPRAQMHLGYDENIDKNEKII